MKDLAIGLLDFGVRRLSMNSLLRVTDLLDYAARADQLGFSRLWLSEHQLSNRTFADQAELDKACLDAWNSLTTERIRSLCKVAWLPEI